MLFSPAFVNQARADDVQEYGTVIGIVSSLPDFGARVYKLKQTIDTNLASLIGPWHRKSILLIYNTFCRVSAPDIP